MESVTDYFPEDEWDEDETEFKTRVWITDEARKEVEACADAACYSAFRSRASKGFKGYIAEAMRAEGDGVLAFGPSGGTGRICFYFLDEGTRKNMIVGGAWKGKSGGRKKGKKRPHVAEAIVARVERMRGEGVQSPAGVLRVS